LVVVTLDDFPVAMFVLEVVVVVMKLVVDDIVDVANDPIVFNFDYKCACGCSITWKASCGKVFTTTRVTSNCISEGASTKCWVNSACTKVSFKSPSYNKRVGIILLVLAVLVFIGLLYSIYYCHRESIKQEKIDNNKPKVTTEEIPMIQTKNNTTNDLTMTAEGIRIIEIDNVPDTAVDNIYGETQNLTIT